MWKSSTIAACVLALSGSAAMAQTNGMTGWMPSGPNDAPGGANGPARVRSIGQGDPNVNDTAGSRTTSSSMLKQEIKTESAMGATSAPGSYAYGQYRPGYAYQAQALTADTEPAYGPHRVYLTDEYGFKYDSQGNRLNSRGYVISPHTR